MIAQPRERLHQLIDRIILLQFRNFEERMHFRSDIDLNGQVAMGDRTRNLVQLLQQAALIKRPNAPHLRGYEEGVYGGKRRR